MANNNRLQWIDALRGLAIICIVLGHSLARCGFTGYSSMVSNIGMTFDLPLFFFISGLLCYKSPRSDKKWISRMVTRRFVPLIVCTIVFPAISQGVAGGG